MPLPNVSITVQNGGLGRVAPSPDKVAGLIVTNQVSTEIPLGTAFRITTSRQVEALTAELSAFAKKELLQFYAEAGEGAELWVMPVVNTKDLGDVVSDHLDALISAGEGRIRILGVSLKPGTPAITDAHPTNFDDDIKALQAALDDLQDQIKPARAVVGSYGFAIAEKADLFDQTDYETPNVGVVLVCDTDAAAANPCTGLTLGRLARNDIQVNIGRVKDGPLAITAAYIGGVKVENIDIADMELFDDSGYLIARTFPGRSGYFFADDKTMIPQTDDFSSLARGRVIDKALTIVYDFFLEEVNENIRVEPATGRLPLQIVKYLEGECANRINREMGFAISDVEVDIDPAQDILATDKLEVSVRIVPVGYLKFIEVGLGFANPFQG